MTLDRDLKDWIEEQKREGYTDSELKDYLVEEGYCTAGEFEEYLKQEQKEKAASIRKKNSSNKRSRTPKKGGGGGWAKYVLLGLVLILLATTIYSLIRLGSLEEKVDSETSKIKSQTSKLESNLSSLSEELDNQIQEAEQEISQTQEDLDQAESSIQETQTQVEGIESKSQETREKINTLSEEVNSTVETLEEEIKGFKPVIDSSIPSIVGIKITYTLNTSQGDINLTARGSGVVIDEGEILTNRHVAAGSINRSAKKYWINVSFHEEGTYEATIKGWSEERDLAILEPAETPVSSLDFGDSDSLKVGEEVVALGNPLGFEFTATKGIVSKVNRELEFEDGTTKQFIQTDASISSGSSGGALINSEGKIVGITTLKASSLLGAEGIGFAIPSNDATEAIENLETGSS